MLSSFGGAEYLRSSCLFLTEHGQGFQFIKEKNSEDEEPWLKKFNSNFLIRVFEASQNI